MKEKLSNLPEWFEKLNITGRITRFVIYLTCAVFSSVFIILALLVQIGVVEPFTFGSLVIGTSVDYVIFAILVSTGIYGIYEFIQIRRTRKIDHRFPDFVRDLSESRRAGMTFTQAIMNSAKGNYGVLSPEVQKIARQVSWGSSVEEALSAFAKRVKTSLIQRTISLIIEASRSGGNVADVLDAASKDAREVKLLEDERRASMLSYVAVVYVGMGVFLMIIAVLANNLIPAIMQEGAESMGGGLGMGASGAINKDDLIQVFFYAALSQSAGMGLVTGVFEEGKLKAGVKHIFILMLITWIVFKVLPLI